MFEIGTMMTDSVIQLTTNGSDKRAKMSPAKFAS